MHDGTTTRRHEPNRNRLGNGVFRIAAAVRLLDKTAKRLSSDFEPAPNARRFRISSRIISALKACFLVVLMLAALREASGDPAGSDHAQAAVRGWLRTERTPLQTTVGQTIKRVETFKDATGTALYHVVYLDPEGFIIVPANDLIEPVIAFAPSGRFDPSTANPLGAMVSRDLPARIAKAKGVKAAQAQGFHLAARKKWEQLKGTDPLSLPAVSGNLTSVSDVRVAPLTMTLWNQLTVGSGFACYNYYTPPYGAGSTSNYYCGCVATAFAQLMRYWQYPTAGVGTNSFWIDVNGVQQNRSLRGGDGAGGPYDWANMVLNPNGVTNVQCQAIGALCADAGVASHMQYSGTGSGAWLIDTKNALLNVFFYSSAVHGGNVNGGTDIGAGLMGMVNPNLDAGSPVLFGIRGSGAHAIVCDGYGYNLSTLYHHLNLGWGGASTAWYNLPNILTYTMVDDCIYNVRTNGTGEIISGRVTDNGGIPVSGVFVTATRTGGDTYTATSNANGIYALAAVPSSSQYTISASHAGYVFTNLVVSTGQSTDFAFTAGNQWAVNFAPDSAIEPGGFTATAVTTSQINLSWARDASNDNVMVAWNTTNVFGIPLGGYSVGDPISGGGTVLCNGSGTNVSHTGLTFGTTYYYKAWSVLAGPSYSSGIQVSGATPGLLAITTSSPLPLGYVSVAYSLSLTATGGFAPYTWSLYDGNLPSGLNLSSAGMITGTPNAQTTATFTVQVTDNVGSSVTQDFSLTVGPAPPPGITFISGGTMNYGGTFMVGTNSPGYGLIVTNAGTLTSSGGVIGNSALATNNFALVTGAGSLWSNSGSLWVGSTGSFNQLTINNAGRVIDTNGYVGYAGTASNNSVLVTGAGSLWSNSGSLWVGTTGSFNQLTITNAGQVIDTSGYIGYAGTASNNSVLVTGDGSVWSNSSGANVGYNGSGNSLTIANGGSVFDNYSWDYIGYNTSASNNSALVTGPGSVWSNTGYLFVGYFGASNRLTISNGGQVYNPWGARIGYSSAASNNSVLVTGTGSVWNNGSWLYVGLNGAGNSLVLANGGQITVNGPTIAGYGSSSYDNSVLASAAGYLASVGLTLGNSGSRSNSVTLQSNTLWNLQGGRLTWGSGAGAFGNSLSIDATSALTNIVGLTLGDNNTTFYMTNSAAGVVFNSFTTNQLQFANGLGGLVVGSGGSGTALIISNYIFNAAGLIIGSNGQNNSVTLMSNSVCNLGGGALVMGGGAGASGNSLSIDASSVLTNIYGLSLGDNNTTYYMTNSAAGLVFNSFTTNQLQFVNGIGSLTVGSGGSGTALIISNYLVNSSWGYVGSTGSSHAVLATGPGAIWSNSSSLSVGYSGSGNNLTVANGGQVFDNNGYAGYNSGANSNTVLVSGSGSLWSNNATVYIGDFGLGNSLTISNGGLVVDNTGYVGPNSGANNNSATVSGNGSLWSNVSLWVGMSGASNMLTVANGGQVVDSLAYVGNNSGANNNTVLVSGSGSLWNNSSILYVGNNGTGNSLVVTNGGQVLCSGFSIGNNGGGNSNAVWVADGGLLWNYASTFTLGYYGSGNSLIVSNGGQVLSTSGSSATMGSQTNSINNTVLVTGTGSVWSNNSSLYLGNSGSSNKLTISNGGQVFDTTAYIGYSASASNNTVLVTGAGSVWTNNGALYVGSSGPGSRLTISNAGTVFSTNVVIGSSPFAGNVLTVSGGWLYASNNTGGGALTVNYGALVLNSGTVVVNRLKANNGTNSVVGFNGGTLDTSWSTVNNGLVLQVGNGTSAATLDLFGGTHSFANGLFINTNATLTGTGAISGSITDAGIIAPGNGLGVITDTGNLTLQGGSTMILELGGTNTWLYDQFDLTGALAYGGTLNVALVNDYTPQLGDRFNLFSFGSANGTFSQVNLPALSFLLCWNTNLLYSSGVIFAAANTNPFALTNVAVMSISTNYADTYMVGNNDPLNGLIVTNGAVFTVSAGVVGNSALASSNAVFVTGIGSVWRSSGSITVGNTGSFNQVIISNTGRVNDTTGYVGYDGTASGNAVVVAGPGSSWSNSSSLYVGYNGSGNSLTIENSSRVFNTYAYIGYNGGSGSNTVVVSGSGSLWANSNYNLYAGYSGSENQLIITNGGRVVSTNTYVGYSASASNNTVLVAGAGSSWSNTSYIFVGYSGQGNQVIITNGGRMYGSNSFVGYYASNNTIQIAGAGSIWSNSGAIYVGFYGSGNQLTVTNGAAVTNQMSYIGENAGANNNSVLVSGPGSIWNSDGSWGYGPYYGDGPYYYFPSLFVGYSGSSNQLTIANGGTVKATGVVIGNQTDAVANAITVNGGSLMPNAYSPLSLDVRRGSLTINSGTVTVTQLLATNGASSVVAFNGGSLNSSGTLISNGTAFLVGGTGATLNLTGGVDAFYNGLTIGGSGGSNQLNVSGITTMTASNLIVGVAGGAAGNGVSLNGGVMTISDGVGRGALNILCGSFTFNGGTATVDRLSLTNGVNSGFLFGSGILNTAGSLVSNGVLFAIGNGTQPATLNLMGGNHSFVNGLVVSSNATLSGAGLLMSGGVTTTNFGTIAIGVPSQVPGGLTNTGNLVEAAGSVLDFGVGRAQGMNCGFLQVQGTVTLNGLLEVALSPYYVDAGGLIGATDVFTVLTAAAPLAGSFSNVASGGQLASLEQLGSFQVNYAGSNVVLSGFQSGAELGVLVVANVLTTNSLLVGSLTPNNQLVVTNGGVLGSALAVLGRTAGSSNNTALVTGSGSIWNDTGSLRIGNFGSGNQMTVAAGGNVSSAAGVLGWATGSCNNAALVTGSGSAWTNTAGLFVGYGDSFNQLTISNAAFVGSLTGYVGYASGSSSNTVLVTGTGSLWSNSSYATVGNSGSFNQLILANSGQMLDKTGYVGYANGANNNAVMVNGSGSVWSNYYDLYVGYAGSANQLIITNGGQVFNYWGNDYVGYTVGSSNNTVLVGGTNALWKTPSGFSLYVGYSGSGNQLTITNGGQVVSSSSYLGYNSSSGNNGVLVSGAGSVWSNGNGLYVGNSGVGNSLTITNGGQVLDWYGFIGNSVSATSNAVLVGGAGSIWSNSFYLYVGFSSSGNQLTVTNGGQVYSSFGSVGLNASASNNAVLVSGAGSLWSNTSSSSFYVGSGSSLDQLTVLNGGQFVAGSSLLVGSGAGTYGNSLFASAAGYLASVGLTIGSSGSQSNSVTLQSNTVWNLRGGSLVWGNGSGAFGNSLNLDASSSITNIYGLSLGENNTTFYMTNSPGGFVLNGFTTNQLQFASGFGKLTVGSGGSGTALVISNYMLNSAGTSYAGSSGTNNSVLVTGPGAVWSNSNMLIVGNAGSGNNLTITNGGQVTDGAGYVGESSAGGQNRVVVAGSNSVWNNTSILYVGWYGSNNSLTIAGGGCVFSPGAEIGLDVSATNNSVWVCGAGSLWSNSSSLYVGVSGTGTGLTMTNGGQVWNTTAYIGDFASSISNAVWVGGAGSVWSNAGTLYVGYSGSGNQLVITNGALVFNTNGVIGNAAGANNNVVTVSGAGSLWTNAGTLDVGMAGVGNQLVIGGGGSVQTLGNLRVGTNAFLSNAGSLATPTLFNMGQFSVSGGTVTVNAMTNSGSLAQSGGLLGPASFDNAGLWQLTSGTNVATVFLNESAGSVWQSGGEQDMNYGTNSGVWSVATNGLLEVRSNLTINSGGNLTNYNGGDMRLVSNATVNVSGSLVITNATLEFAGASTAATPFLPGVTFQNASAIKWAGYGGSFGSHAITGNLNLDLPSGPGLMNGIVDNASLTVGGGNGVLYVGSNNLDSLTITNGGHVSDYTGYIGFGASASNNSVLVGGAGSLWNNGYDFYVGNFGSFNQLTITNGGQVSDGLGYIGNNVGANNNTVLVTGTGSVWNTGLRVGNYGASNQLTVANGGTVSGYIQIGYSGDNNAMTVTGTGSVVNNTALELGWGSTGNQLTVANGARMLNSQNCDIGFNSGANSNLLTVTGAGSFWSNNNYMLVGAAGSFNQLTISSGARAFNNGTAYVGYNASGGNNAVLVSGAGSIWTNNGDLNVGYFGSDNSLVVGSSGNVFNVNGYIGNQAGANSNAVSVTGAGSVWNNSSSLFVGYSGVANSLTLTNGGTVSATNIVVGAAASSTGNVLNVSGGRLYATNSAGGGAINVLYGALNLNSGTVAVDWLLLTNGVNSVFNFNGGVLDACHLLSARPVTVNGGTLSLASCFVNSTGGTFQLNSGGVIVPGSMANQGSFIQNGGLFDPLVFTNSGSFILNSGTNMDGVFLNLASGTVQQSGGEHDVNVATNYGSWAISGGVANLTNLVIDGGGVFTNAGGTLVSTNALGTGGMDVRNGTLVFNGGSITANSLWMTNNVSRTNAVFNFVAGTLTTTTNSTIGTYFQDFVIGSGTAMGQTGIWNIVGGTVQTMSGIGNIVIGNNTAGNGVGIVNVTGPGSALSDLHLGSSLYVGFSGADNQLTIANGGAVSDYTSYVGNNAGANSNVVTVTGAGSVWNNNLFLILGAFGSGNQLIITNGGAVSGGGDIGANSGANNNTATVTGPGSLWNNGGNPLYVGNSSVGNQLTIANNGAVSDTAGYVGYVAGANSNTVLVTGPGSLWSNSSSLYVGNSSVGNQLTIANGGAVSDTASYIGNASGANSNAVTVTGPGSVWNGGAFLYVGYGGSNNQLTITNGGTVLDTISAIGYSAGANSNTVLVAGANSFWSNITKLAVGLYGSDNQLIIANSGVVFNAIGYVGYQWGANSNMALVTGPGSVWSNSSTLYVGDYASSNILTIANAGTVAAATNIVIGNYASTGNVITVSGGYLYATNVAAGGSLSVNYGLLNLNSGAVTVNQFYATNFANSIVNFNGGTLNSGGSMINNGSIFRVGNGVSAATLDLFGGTHSFANGLFIDTNAILTGTGAITGSITDAGLIAPGNGFGVITDTGNLTMLGNGAVTMELGGTNTWLYDQFDLTGALSFGGTLNVALLNGYTPQAGDQFNLFDFGSGSGVFSATNLPTLSPTLYWNTSALYSSGVIAADQSTGSVQVVLAPQAAIDAGAKWQVDADGNWHTNNETVSGLVVGSHTLSYTNLTGWIAPTNQTVQIVFGATTTNTGTYQLTPLLLAAVSRKTQGAGTFDLNLNLNGTPSATVEPRISGPTQLVFTFNKAMAAADGTLDATEFTLTNATFVSANIVTSNLTLNLTSVVDQSKVTVVMNGLTDLAGNLLSGTNAVLVRSLYGDVNQSGTVNGVDLQQVKNNLLTTLTPANFLCDVNCSGTINAVDLQQIKNNLLHSASLADSGAAQTLSSSDASSSVTTLALSTTTLGQALGATNLTWTTDGDAPWTTTIAEDGSQAAWSGIIGNLNVSWVETTVTGPGTLSFDWMVSSELNGDYLTFAIDGVDQPGRISGELGWQTPTFSIPAGTHRLTWTYSKNGSTATGLDAGWLRRVVYR